MSSIIAKVAELGREETGYVIIDVRNQEEIIATGKLDPVVETLPLPLIGNAMQMEEEDFLEQFGFDKPQLDETVVFTCKAGIRSMQASQFAAMCGYGKLVNYRGGADEWFGSTAGW